MIHISDKPSLQWIFRDISERQYMEELREDLSAMIYHDLRSPLANIISSLDILRTMLPEETPSAIQLVDIAQRSSERLQRLISSLLDVHRLESGQQITEKKSLNIAALIDEVDGDRNPCCHFPPDYDRKRNSWFLAGSYWG